MVFNICDNDKIDGMTPVIKLLKLSHCNQEWLRLLLEFDGCDFNSNKNNEKYIVWFGKTFVQIVEDNSDETWAFDAAQTLFVLGHRL